MKEAIKHPDVAIGPDATPSLDAALVPRTPFGRALLVTARWLAFTGGAVFVALVVMSIVSIVGRKVASWPVPGDVELLQMCAAFASSSFFAYCHLIGGDVKVDFFTHNLPPSIVNRLDAFGSLLVGSFGALVAWRTGVGALAFIMGSVLTTGGFATGRGIMPFIASNRDGLCGFSALVSSLLRRQNAKRMAYSCGTTMGPNHVPY